MKTMKNRMEEPDSWAVIDNLDLEQEIEAEQQRFLFLAAVALLFWSHTMHEIRSQCDQQNNGSISDLLDWNDHVTKLLHRHLSCLWSLLFKCFCNHSNFP